MLGLHSPIDAVGKLKLAGRRVVFEAIIFFFKTAIGSLDQQGRVPHASRTRLL